MLEITKALNNAKSLYNLIRLSGNYEMLDKLDFQKLTKVGNVFGRAERVSADAEHVVLSGGDPPHSLRP